VGQKFAESGFLGCSLFAGIKDERRIVTELGESLAAGSAGHGSCLVEIGDGYGAQADSGAVLGDSASDGSLLCAAGEAIGAVLDVASGDDFAV